MHEARCQDALPALLLERLRVARPRSRRESGLKADEVFTGRSDGHCAVGWSELASCCLALVRSLPGIVMLPPTLRCPSFVALVRARAGAWREPNGFRAVRPAPVAATRHPAVARKRPRKAPTCRPVLQSGGFPH